jgi:hypothetical protein
MKIEKKRNHTPSTTNLLFGSMSKFGSGTEMKNDARDSTT